MSYIKWNKEEFELLWKEKDNWKQEDGMYICPICNRVCKPLGIKNHIKISHFNYPPSKGNLGKTGKISWNKGLTKEIDERVKKGGETLSKNIKEGKIIPSFKGKHHTKETKTKMSRSMKKAHIEDRAWNIGYYRHKKEPSYPEKFFIQIIENEFLDKNYQTEFSFGKYSLDFAWPHIKKCIEIDGDQHYRSEEYIERDKRKDKLLENNYWQVLRIRWKDMSDDPKKWIQIARKFIEEDVEHLNDNLRQYQKEIEEKERLTLYKKKLRLEKSKIKKYQKKKIDKYHEIALKINALIDSDINFSKYGWIQKASKIISISPQKTRTWIERNYPKLLEEAFVRKNN